MRRPAPAAGIIAAAAQAQTTTINGSSLALRSSGAVAGTTGWTLSSNGYVGTYITLANPGTVSFSVSASGISATYAGAVTGKTMSGSLKVTCGTATGVGDFKLKKK